MADWEDPANQDRLTDLVWLTRKNTMSLFNIKTEDGYQSNFSPEGTEWAFGTTAEINMLEFENFQETNMSAPQDMVGLDMVVHLIEEDIYIDIKFLSWSGGGPGDPERRLGVLLNAGLEGLGEAVQRSFVFGAEIGFFRLRVACGVGPCLCRLCFR